jgi:hypothetical protein
MESLQGSAWRASRVLHGEPPGFCMESLQGPAWRASRVLDGEPPGFCMESLQGSSGSGPHNCTLYVETVLQAVLMMYPDGETAFLPFLLLCKEWFNCSQARLVQRQLFGAGLVHPLF